MRSGWWGRLQDAAIRRSASPAFRDWAARFPLTRPVARRRARQLFDICAGFVYSQVLLACVRLRLFEILADSPQTLAQLAQRLALSEEAAARLVDAAVALRLLRRDRDAQLALGPLGAALVGNEALHALIEHNALLYADLQDPVALLRGSASHAGLARYWPYAASGDAAQAPAAAAYSELMARSQSLIAQEILDAYPLHRHQCLLDIGGGNGAFLAAVAPRAPRLALQLFDLPAVAALARHRLAGLIEAGRAQVVGGSFLEDPLPRGADVVSLVRVLHDHDDGAVTRLLRAVREVLPARGRVLVAEPLAATPGAETVGAYFDFYLFAMGGGGRPRTRAEISALLLAAGFSRPRCVHTRLPLQTSLLVADAGRANRA